MHCPHCYTEFPDKESFCSKCGAPRVSTSMFAPDPTAQEQERLRQANSGSNFLIGIACVIGALVSLSFFIGIAMFNLQSKDFQQRRIAALSAGDIEVGSDFNLYGRTLDDEDFDWESLRGKVVLVKFTATWCGPCKGEVPGMLEAYKKYHDKGFEIVSVYIWQDRGGIDPVATVKQFVEREKLPWIIVSESLTEKAGQPPQGKSFGIQGVPTMLLVDKEGKVYAADARGVTLQQELQKLFGE